MVRKREQKKTEPIQVWKIIMNANIDFIKDITERFSSLEYELEKKLKTMFVDPFAFFFFPFSIKLTSFLS